MKSYSDSYLNASNQQTPSDQFIHLENIQHWYKSAQESSPALALNSVNLEIGRGEFIAVWGPSGSGKSTLCNLTGGLDAPKEGRVFWQGRDLKDLNDDDLSSKRNQFVGFVFQQFNLIPVLSTWENVLLPHQISGGSQKKGHEKARRLFNELQISELKDRRPDQVSGGQRQRVAIARALINEPSLVIADEPTANLDTQNAEHLVERMRYLNKQYGTTFLFATHDERLLASVDRKLHLVDGKIDQDERRLQ